MYQAQYFNICMLLQSMHGDSKKYTHQIWVKRSVVYHVEIRWKLIIVHNLEVYTMSYIAIHVQASEQRWYSFQFSIKDPKVVCAADKRSLIESVANFLQKWWYLAWEVSLFTLVGISVHKFITDLASVKTSRTHLWAHSVTQHVLSTPSLVSCWSNCCQELIITDQDDIQKFQLLWSR